ncbi:hypothetical protein EDD36DRAFT_420636 [Exophiala viscosa]|uniref:NAD-dependent epimerase/dehydratase domain-containing protein n=1 Tax=Exophiala viscosa TaxID=2486360 RepID=A0AAN6DUF3_9EURO|nr:hypothetical protein EDD36DRAFT_420636 [Exophiala viscosa]
MAASTILLTGATGLVGATTLFQLMTQTNHTISARRLSFLEIPDMTRPGVFDHAAAQSDAIIHIATPLAYDDVIEKMVKPSWTIVHNVLLAAEKSSRTKRVIVTGSMVATFRLPNDLFSGRWAHSRECVPVLQGPFRAGGVEVYENRSFDLIYMLAPAITGKSIHPGFLPSKEALGGQAGIYRDLFDKETPGFVFPYFMDIEDVAKVHIRFLSPSVPGNERYLFHARELMTGNDMARAMREDFPELRSRVPAPDEAAGDTLPRNLVKTAISKAEKVFGTEWKSARQTTHETVADIIAF